MDKYTELELVGKGSYGKVYKVKHKNNGDVYVCKKMAFDGTPQSEAEASLREARLLSLLRHPHVVPYKEFFKHTDGGLCLVMAFCEGGDLFKYIRELKKLDQTVPEQQVWAWLVQLLLALSYIHSKKILHRDVKTQNIFLSEGKMLLGDFGLAKQLQRTFEMARTPIGTPYYMAPEIYEEQPYSFKSDVWALGCVMYEMLCGKPAFAADNLSRVVLRVIRGNYDPIPETYSQALRNVVMSMLCKDTKKRPDANELLTYPAVAPHVKAYLEQLSGEGPGGWATWRMKLPLKAMVQNNAALEFPPAMKAAAGPLPRAVEDRMTGSQLVEEFSLEDLLQDPRTKEGQSAAIEAAAEAAAAATGKPSKLPPLRTPYGFATPFMAPTGGPYAELQVLAQQVAHVRVKQHDAKGAAAAAGAAPPVTPPNVKALDRVLVHTLKQIQKVPVPGPAAENGKGAGDEDWITNSLPKGNFASPSGKAAAEPFNMDDLRNLLPPKPPATPQVAAPARANAYNIDDSDCVSMGQISIHESFAQRKINLREQCQQVLPEPLFTRVMAVVKKVEQAGGSEEQLKAQLKAVLSMAQMSPILHVLEELVFLESKAPSK